jgi:hypothetical protein
MLHLHPKGYTRPLFLPPTGGPHLSGRHLDLARRPGRARRFCQPSIASPSETLASPARNPTYKTLGYSSLALLSSLPRILPQTDTIPRRNPPSVQAFPLDSGDSSEHASLISLLPSSLSSGAPHDPLVLSYFASDRASTSRTEEELCPRPSSRNSASPEEAIDEAIDVIDLPSPR